MLLHFSTRVNSPGLLSHACSPHSAEWTFISRTRMSGAGATASRPDRLARSHPRRSSSITTGDARASFFTPLDDFLATHISASCTLGYR